MWKIITMVDGNDNDGKDKDGKIMMEKMMLDGIIMTIKMPHASPKLQLQLLQQDIVNVT